MLPACYMDTFLLKPGLCLIKLVLRAFPDGVKDKLSKINDKAIPDAPIIDFIFKCPVLNILS